MSEQPQPEHSGSPRVWVEEIGFSGADRINLGADDIIVITGPNNTGKSAALRGVRDYLVKPHFQHPVISDLITNRSGTFLDVINKLERTARRHPKTDPNVTTYEAFGVGVNTNNVKNWWDNKATCLHQLFRTFCHVLTAEERLSTLHNVQSISVARDAPISPLHLFITDDDLEQKVSDKFREAFGLDLLLNRCDGMTLPLHVGNRPRTPPRGDRLSSQYVKAIAALPALSEQGDGMRAFAAILAWTIAGQESILLIDEPEAFLHPPQARLLGRTLATDKPPGRQLFVATHSGDFLRGVLDANRPNVRVVRLNRVGDKNYASQLDSQSIAQLWRDPLFRSSNILDGVFHERVVVCESDGDARFYSAVTDALIESSAGERRRPDIMFAHVNGKDRIPSVVKALRGVSVPVAAVADFDVLNAEQPLRRTVEAAGGDWSAFEADWKVVMAAASSETPELRSADVKREIGAILDAELPAQLPGPVKHRIQDVLKRSSPWAKIKGIGRRYFKGEANAACGRLLQQLKAIGVYVVPIGELESFVPEIGGGKPQWLNAVLTRDLANDPALREAREFVTELVWAASPVPT